MPTEVLIFDQHAPEYREHLARRFPDVTFHTTESLDEAKRLIRTADVLIALAPRVPRELVAAAPKLKWLQTLTTGTDPLDQEGFLPPDVLLTSCRGVHGPQMSELAFLHMIALSRDFRRMQANQAQAKWERWNQPILEDKTIVIVGLGILAEHLAERCKLFGMTVIGVSDGRTKGPNFDEVHPRKRLAQVAARADFLLLLVPYSKATHHLINRSVLEAMKPTAFLINLARGAVLDEAALAELLKAGRIAGAGLDIFARQPLAPDSPFWTMPNVIVTPNIGGHSDKFVQQTLTVVEPNLAAFLAGRLNDMRNVVKH
jgi:phosphoglycerate dehydrogenase-like enzyme